MRLFFAVFLHGEVDERHPAYMRSEIAVQQTDLNGAVAAIERPELKVKRIGDFMIFFDAAFPRPQIGYRI